MEVVEGKRSDSVDGVGHHREQTGRPRPFAAFVGAVMPIGQAVIVLIVAGVTVAVVSQRVEVKARAQPPPHTNHKAVTRVAWKSPHLVSIRVPNERIVAGQTAVGEITVCNERDRPVWSGITELPTGSGIGEFIVLPLGARRSWDEMFLISLRHRGLINVGPVCSVRFDALGLLCRVRVWDGPVILHAYPKTVRAPFDATGFQLDVESVSMGRLSSPDVSFHTLHDCGPGDGRRAVYWQPTARLGKLIARQYEETYCSHHVIVLDTPRDAWDRDSFETMVFAVASLGLASLREPRSVSATTTEAWLPSGSAMRLLDTLLEIKAGSGGDLALRVREAVTKRPGIPAPTLVVGPKVSDIDAAHLVRLAPIDVPVSIIRIGGAKGRARRDPGRRVLLDCSRLEDLPRIIIAGGLA